MTELINGRTPEYIKRVLEWANLACGDMDCEECPYYENVCSHESYEKIAPYALALIEHLEAKVPKWISVKYELPPRELNILAVNGHGRIKIMALLRKVDKRWTWIEDSRLTHRNDITHWMPLPERPEEYKHEAE